MVTFEIYICFGRLNARTVQSEIPLSFVFYIIYKTLENDMKYSINSDRRVDLTEFLPMLI